MAIQDLAKDVELTSKANSLNKNDLIAVGQHAGLVGAAAVVTYLLQHLGMVDFGQYSAMVVPILSGLLITAQKWLADNTKE
jgi:hypothetical protein